MAADMDAWVARIAADRTSGASEIHKEVLDLLTRALSRKWPIRPLARQLISAQPSMAPVWTAVARALVAEGNPALFDQYVEQMSRADRSVVRHSTSLLRAEAGQPSRVVTLSFSATVLRTLEVLATEAALTVACAEGQPGREGRRLAEVLAAREIGVDYYTDAALGHALADADVVLVGADAVAPGWFLNKSGTRMLVAAAAQQGVPVYVLATRDKFVSDAVGSRLAIRQGPASEVWPAPPSGVRVHNPYFERVPLDFVTAVISDMGVLGAAIVPDACPTTHDQLLLNL